MKDLMAFVRYAALFLTCYLIGVAVCVSGAVAVIWMIEGARHVLP